MEAACKGARTSDNYHEGDTIGILPGLHRNEANQYVDIALTTGMGIARNIIVASSQAIPRRIHSEI
jgi:uncharacterized protein (TIGR00725 family)